MLGTELRELVVRHWLPGEGSGKKCFLNRKRHLSILKASKHRVSKLGVFQLQPGVIVKQLPFEAEAVPSICTRCGAAFSCLAAEGCWCFAVTPPSQTEPVPGELCLCPECLKLRK